MAEIPGATEATYTPTEADVGYRIRVAERVKSPTGTSEWVFSDWIGPITEAGGPSNVIPTTVPFTLG